MIKLVAFDWNGTILADTYAVFEADNEIIKYLGLKPNTFYRFQKYFDVPVIKYFEALGADKKQLHEESEKIAKIFIDAYEPRAKHVRTRSHARTVLEWLKKQKIQTAIFSNHVVENINIQLTRLKIKSYFTEVLANSINHSAYTERTKMGRLENYMKKYQLKPNEVLIVGDTIEEIEIAKEIGCMCVAITQGNCAADRLEKAKPDYLIGDLGNLINIIREINSD